MVWAVGGREGGRASRENLGGRDGRVRLSAVLALQHRIASARHRREQPESDLEVGGDSMY